MKLLQHLVGSHIQEVVLADWNGEQILFALGKDGNAMKGHLGSLKNCIEGKYEQVFTHQGAVFFLAHSEETVICLPTGESIKRPYWIFPEGFSNIESDYYCIVSNGVESLARMDKGTYEIAEKYDFPSQYKFFELVTDDHLIGFSAGKIECFDFKSKHVSWTHIWKSVLGFDEIQYGLRKVLWSGKLFFTVDPKNNLALPRLCSVDIVSGEFVVHQDDFSRDLRYSDCIISGIGHPSALIQYNLLSERTSVIDFSVDLKNAGLHGFHAYLWELDADRFVFYQEAGSHSAIVGVFDCASRKLMCYYGFPPERGAMASMLVDKNYIYCLLQDSTLHRLEIIS